MAIIQGSASSEPLTGTTSNDTINGAGGSDTIDGLAGTDTAVFSSNSINFQVTELSGIVQVKALSTAIFPYQFTTTKLIHTEKIQFTNLTRDLFLSTNNIILNNNFQDIIGTAQNDTIDSRGMSRFINGGAGADTAVFFGNSSNFNITELNGAVRLTGLSTAPAEYRGVTVKLLNTEKVHFADLPPVELIPTTNNIILNNNFQDIIGTTQNDTIDSNGWSDFIDGGAGTDTAVFFGNSSDFNITELSGAVRLTGLDTAPSDYRGDTVRLRNIEQVQFIDKIHLLAPTTNNIILNNNFQDIIGTAQNDTIDSRGLSRFINGGDGADTAVFFGNRSDFNITELSGAVRLTGLSTAPAEYRGVTVKLLNTEKVHFADLPPVELIPTTNNIILNNNFQDIIGTTQNDTIDSNGWSNFIDGGAGTDTAVFFGNSSDFNITELSGAVRLTGLDTAPSDYRGDTVRLRNIEQVQFIDKIHLLAPTTNNIILNNNFQDIIGTAQNDTIDSRGLSRFINGGDGTDTAVFFANRSDFSVVNLSGVIQVTGLNTAPSEYRGVTTQLTNIENVQFASDVATTLAPEIAVSGNTINITDGDSTPDPIDGTSFGNVAQGGAAAVLTFTVKNDGGATLTLGASVLPSGFSIVSTDPLVTSLAPGASDTFQVRLDSTVAGTKSGQISIATNDSNENPFNFSINGTVTTQSLPTTATIFNTAGQLGSDGTNVGIFDTGMIRVMADFSKAAYSLQSWENNQINDISPYADSARNEIINVQKWQPLLDLNPILAPTTTITGLDSIHPWSVFTSNKMSDGYYTNGNAAALVARSSDALVISFRGTNDNADQFSPNNNINDSNNYIHPDKDQWGSSSAFSTMADHYNLFTPLFTALNTYVSTDSSIKNIYVTGHSLGGAMAINYLNEHIGDNRYQGVTFAAPGFQLAVGKKEFIDNPQLLQIEIDEDPVPITWNVISSQNRPGDVIRFSGNQTMDEPDNHIIFEANDDNHSMDYYRQITDSIDSTSWSRILSETGDQRVFIGAASGPNFDPIDRHDPYVAGDPFDTYFIVDGRLSGVNTILTNSDNDNLTDPLLSDYEIYYGGRGVDTLTGGGAKELMLGGSGNDKLYGNGDSDRLFGDAGNDTLDGGSGVDTLIGGLGDDTYVVENASDVITENPGTLAGTKDHVNSYLISYTLPANVENLTLKLPPLGANNNGTGNGLANIITGNALINILNGAAGNDRLLGKGGKDTLTGGAGADKFIFDTATGTNNIDTITDFVTNTDKILLDDDIFTALGITGTAAGVALTAGKFHAGASALDTLDRIIYNPATGALFYDANGSVSGQNVQIALIGTSTHPTLSAADFQVIA